LFGLIYCQRLNMTRSATGRTVTCHVGIQCRHAFLFNQCSILLGKCFSASDCVCISGFWGFHPDPHLDELTMDAVRGSPLCPFYLQTLATPLLFAMIKHGKWKKKSAPISICMYQYDVTFVILLRLD